MKILKTLMEKIKRYWMWVTASIVAAIGGLVVFLVPSKKKISKPPVDFSDKLQEKLDNQVESSKEGLNKIIEEIREERENLSNLQEQPKPEVRLTSFEQVKYAKKIASPPPVPSSRRRN